MINNTNKNYYVDEVIDMSEVVGEGFEERDKNMEKMSNSSGVIFNQCSSYMYYKLSKSPYRVGGPKSKFPGVKKDGSKEFYQMVNRNTTYLATLIKSVVNDMERNDIEEAIVADNLPLIFKKVKKKLPEENVDGSVDVNDVFQKVVWEYLKKLDTFDASKGYAFNTFAMSHLGNTAKDFVDDNRSHSMVKSDTYHKIGKIWNEFKEYWKNEQGSRADFVEMASKKYDISKKLVNDYLDSKINGTFTPTYFEATLKEGDGEGEDYDLYDTTGSDYMEPSVVLERERLEEMAYAIETAKGSEVASLRKKFAAEILREAA